MAAARAAYEIVPAHPPLPTPWNFPFHPDVGSQTSILMSESLEGFNVAATRQNDGRARNAWIASGAGAVAPGGVGGTNAPGSTVCASVIVVFGSTTDVRLSQVDGAASR